MSISRAVLRSVASFYIRLLIIRCALSLCVCDVFMSYPFVFIFRFNLLKLKKDAICKSFHLVFIRRLAHQSTAAM